MCHMSDVRCQVSCVRCHVFFCFFYKVVEFSGKTKELRRGQEKGEGREKEGSILVSPYLV